MGSPISLQARRGARVAGAWSGGEGGSEARERGLAACGSPSAAERAGRAARSAAPKLVSGTLNGYDTLTSASSKDRKTVQKKESPGRGNDRGFVKQCTTRTSCNARRKYRRLLAVS